MAGVEELRAVFASIYNENIWSFGSGPGSMPENTIQYRSFLEAFFRANQIKTVTDFGCGDWQFSRLIDWSGIIYTGFDVVPEVVHENQKRFTASTIGFQTFEKLEDLPGGDLLIAKEVFQHLPNRVIIEYLGSILRKYRFSLITNNVEPHAHCNLDTNAGGCRPLRLDEEPFLVRGANVFTYYVFADGTYWKNSVFLAIGE